MKRLYVSDDGKRFEELSAVAIVPNLVPVKKTLLFRAIGDYYRNFSKKKSELSFSNERTYFSNFYQFCTDRGVFYVDEVTFQLLIEYKNSLKNISPATINRQFTTYRHFFNIQMRSETILKNPIVLIKPEKVPDPVIELWNPRDFIRVRRSANRRLRNILNFLWYSGARSCEAVNLRWQDIQWDQGIINLYSGKNGGIRREFPITPRISKLLHTMECKGVYVFGERYKFTSDSLSKETRKKIRLVSENKNLDVKSIRHTFCTNLVLKGFSQPEIKKLMGHRSWRTTEKYIHLKRKHLQKSRALI